jgi:class 3 adenylate cyclase/tetratricopeptide (TPR) repeat protein
MSKSPKFERKLAAIMFTDIAGYTESMSYDENEAIAAVRKKRSVLQPLIKEYNGVFIKEIGDGTLSYFSSAVDASTCAVKLQEFTYDEDHLNIRIGLHIGDIVFDGQDVFGEGVNIASRLESLSPVGGVCVSKNVYDELENKKEFNGTSLGLQSLKGVGRLVEVYALKGDKLQEPDTVKYKETEIQKHSDDEVPSIAIIPFENKGAEEDVFYAFGISSDLISDVTSAGLIRVASLKDIEKQDYLSLENNELSKKLFVRYISQGTLWKMNNIFQLSIELYDTKDHKVVWSDRWQENWDNLSSIKGKLSDGLLKALDTKPKEEPKFDETNNEAYELYLKAQHIYSKRENTNDAEIARKILKESISLDGNLIPAKIALSSTFVDTGDYDMAMDISLSALNQAEQLGDKKGIGNSLNIIGTVHYYRGDYNKSLEYFGKWHDIKEQLGDKKGIGNSLNNIGLVYWNLGNFEKSLEYNNRSLKIHKELDDKRGTASSFHNIGLVHLDKGEIDKALDCYKKSLSIKEEISDKQGIASSFLNIGIVYFYKGRYDAALDYYNRSLVIDKEIGDKHKIGMSLNNIGSVYLNKGEFDIALDYFIRSHEIYKDLRDKTMISLNLFNIGNAYSSKGKFEQAKEYLERSIMILKEIGASPNDLIEKLIALHFVDKYSSENYNKKEILKLLSDDMSFDYTFNYTLYKLLEKKSYLKSAYSQIQDKVSAMSDKSKEKFINYPIPKIIIEEYNKIK